MFFTERRSQHPSERFDELCFHFRTERRVGSLFFIIYERVFRIFEVLGTQMPDETFVEDGDSHFLIQKHTPLIEIRRTDIGGFLVHKNELGVIEACVVVVDICSVKDKILKRRETGLFHESVIAFQRKQNMNVHPALERFQQFPVNPSGRNEVGTADEDFSPGPPDHRKESIFDSDSVECYKLEGVFSSFPVSDGRKSAPGIVRPVTCDDPMQIADNRTCQPQMIVTPVDELGTFSDVLPADVETAHVADHSVDDHHFPVVPPVESIEEKRELRRLCEGYVHARFLQSTVFPAQRRAYEPVNEKVDPYPFFRFHFEKCHKLTADDIPSYEIIVYVNLILGLGDLVEQILKKRGAVFVEAVVPSRLFERKRTVMFALTSPAENQIEHDP